jgi:uncharacterized membrane protein
VFAEFLCYKQHFLYPKNFACKLACDVSVGLKDNKLNKIANSFLDVLVEAGNLKDELSAVGEEEEEEEMKLEEKEDEINSTMQQSNFPAESEWGVTLKIQVPTLIWMTIPIWRKALMTGRILCKLVSR